jgi:beta-galactosidase GanA
VYVATYLVGDVRNVLVSTLCEATRVKPQLPDLPAGVEVVQRRAADNARTLWFLINHSEASVVIPAAPAGRDLITGHSTSDGPLTLETFGVAVIEAT